MRKVMDDLLEGGFDYERPESDQEVYDDGILDLSSLSLELFLQKGETEEGSFLISVSGPQERLMEGYVYSTEQRMECLTKEFIGVKEEIMYRFDSTGMQEGDILEGQFSIISNYGEYELPYRIEITGSSVTSSLGDIKNMFHFANLAKANWKEAVKLFYSNNFKKIFTDGNDRQYYSAYKGLSAVYGNEQNVEEFLLEINKKQRIEYIPEESEVCIEDPYDVSEHSLLITRNGWGHTFLNIHTEGEFITAEKERISDDEFLGNSFRLNYYIDSEKLHVGRNYGRIHIFNSCMSITIPVTVVRNMEHKGTLGIRKEKKRILLQLMKYYDSFRMKKINARTWLGETEVLVERLAVLDDKDIQTKLFRIQILITQERFNEANWQLERMSMEIREGNCSPEIYSYYIYLTTLHAGEAAYIDEVSRRVERLYYANRDNWRIAWLMLYLSEEYGRSPSKRWQFLEEQYARGGRSPVLYVEAWHLLDLNPTLLMKLDGFEVQVLNYAAKRGLLTQNLIMQIRYLALKLKDYSERVFYILKECYEKYADKETLQVICTLLIKGNKTECSYFKWYALGVKKELRITKLYEYYMMSLPEDYSESLPKIILMYFAYQSELHYSKNAFLYAYVYRRKDEQPELYLNYCEQIERFVLEQIRRGRINRDLAYLYKNTISPRMINEEVAVNLAPLLFTYHITMDNKEIRQVIVGYSISKEEYKYPVSDGGAWLPLYGRDYKILLEDGNENRYCTSIPFHIEKVMLPGKLLAMISPFIKAHRGFAHYMCEEGKVFAEITEENEKWFRYLADDEHMESEFKRVVRLKLVHYYYEQDRMKELDSYLSELRPEVMDNKERAEILRFMVIRGMYDDAFTWIKTFGVNGVETKTIVRLCSRLISRDGFMEDDVLTYAVYYAFKKGKYDGNLITYLVYFYNGMIKQMRDVWKAAAAFDADTYALSERILVQMLFSGAFIGEKMDIFKAYVAGGAKTQIESAFLSGCAYDYFVKDKLTDEFLLMDTIRVHERGERLDKVCKLALLKYYAENKKDITPKVRAAINTFLCDMLEENIYFPFFKEYTKELPLMKQFEDKTMIEYKVRPGRKALIHYMIERGSFTEKEFKKEEMRNMYGGVCVKAFILFFGEKLQYYIMEEGDGKEQLTESASISKSDILQDEEEDRFGMINGIVIGKTLQDYNTVNSLLEEYFRKEYMTSQIFTLR